MCHPPKSIIQKTNKPNNNMSLTPKLKVKIITDSENMESIPFTMLGLEIVIV